MIWYGGEVRKKRDLEFPGDYAEYEKRGKICEG